MPTYKFAPDIAKYPEVLFTFVDVYDTEKKKSETIRIVHGQEFVTDKYYSAAYMKHEHFEFISDKPYISPILCSFNGSEKCHLEVPDCGHLFDIFVATLDKPVKLYFNENAKGQHMLITKESSGVIFKNMAPAGIRVVNAFCDSQYSVAILLTNHFAANNG